MTLGKTVGWKLYGLLFEVELISIIIVCFHTGEMFSKEILSKSIRYGRHFILCYVFLIYIFITSGLPAIVVGVTMAVNLDNYGGGY